MIRDYSGQRRQRRTAEWATSATALQRSGLVIAARTTPRRAHVCQVLVKEGSA